MDEHIKEFIRLNPQREKVVRRLVFNDKRMTEDKQYISILYRTPLEELPNKIQQGNSTYSKLANFIINKRLESGS